MEDKKIKVSVDELRHRLEQASNDGHGGKDVAFNVPGNAAKFKIADAGLASHTDCFEISLAQATPTSETGLPEETPEGQVEENGAASTTRNAATERQLRGEAPAPHTTHKAEHPKK